MRECRVAAGQNTTFMLARPNDKLSDLPRHPDEVGTEDECLVCHKDKKGDSPIVCEKVPIPSLPHFFFPPSHRLPPSSHFHSDPQEI